MNNLYLIIGEDYKLINFEINKIISKITYPEENKITYDLSTNTLADILDEASTLSLFSSIKIIIGNNFDIKKVSENEIEYLNKYLTNSNKDIYIILVASKIDGRINTFKIFKNSFKIIELAKLNNKEDVLMYISKKIKDNHYQIDNYLIEYFLNKTGNDINNINSELAKLFLYKIDNKIITKEDIDLLIIDNIDNVIYEFTNAFLENDLNKVVSMYNSFKKENLSFDYIVTSLSNSIHTSLVIKMLHNDNRTNLDISKIIGKKEFYVKKMLERLYQYTEEDLTNYLNKLALIDYNYKSGKSYLDELELFLINH